MKDCLLNRFVSVTKANADQPFFTMVESGKTYSFGQFSADVHAVAYKLLHEYPQTSIIVLSGNNSYEFAVYAVAVILSGKTLFPLNIHESELQKKKLLSMLEHEFFLFTNDQLQIPSLAPCDFMLPGTNEDVDIVYMATSASTGDSKIVRQREKSLLSNVDDLIHHHGLVSGKKIATSLPLFHVNALHFSFFCSLLNGGHIYLFESFHPRLFCQTIEKEKIQIASVIPVLLTNLINHADQLSQYDLSSLDYFVSAAAPLSTSIVENIQKFFGKRILQGYGLSEAINFSCVLPRNLPETIYNQCMIKENFPSIGIALNHTVITIENGNGANCAEGEVGEILLSGDHVMPGYLGSDAGFKNGCLITGDLGFYRTYGGEKFYFIAGRKKEVAKVAGESVSLRELDEQLRTFVILKNDFITTFFENDFKGEELALICSVQSGESVEILSEQFSKALQHFPLSRTPKVLLFVESAAIRTASGKAKRFQFKDQFNEFKTKRFLNQQIIKKL